MRRSILAVALLASFIAACSSSAPTSLADESCEELQPRIVRLSEGNKNPMAPRILKLYEVTEVDRTETKLTCHAVAKWNRGEDSPVAFYMELDVDGDAFIGYKGIEATPTPAPTEAPTTSEPTPTPTIAPTTEPTPEPEPIRVKGNGDVATDTIHVPFAFAVLSIRHTGEGYFGIVAYQGDARQLLVNEAGSYVGKRWLVAGEYIFDINADGAWEIVMTPISVQESVAEDGFSGVGDDVSGLFTPPGTQAWELSHAGDGYFGVIVNCAGGRGLIANEAGNYSGSSILMFPEGPCFFAVSANGAFSITPRR